MRILIAEDDRVSRLFIQGLLTRWGHEVVVACDGKAAWDVLQDPQAPSLVVLDWMMPGIDGVDICMMLRGVRRDIRPYVILLTGRGKKQDVVRGIGAGADDYLTKPFDPDELRVRILAGERIINLQVESLTVMESLRKQATRDYVTGLPNRATIIDLLRRELSRAPRLGTHVSVVMADLDHFKSVNDTYGHSSGDLVLREAAKRMAVEMRSYEHIGRYGGEEFLIVLSACDIAGAAAVAERLRQTLAARPFDLAADRVPVMASFGAASSSQLRAPSENLLIEMADVAMYRAKNAGRNRVECMAEDAGSLASR